MQAEHGSHPHHRRLTNSLRPTEQVADFLSGNGPPRTFAESLLSRPITDWSRPEVANAMADQVLATEQENINRPRWIWTGYHEEDKIKGFSWYRESNSTVMLRTDFNASEFHRMIAPFPRSDGQFSSKDPIPKEMAALFGLDASSPHENYDGSGYPDGLGGLKIPLEARIVKLMDVYDALRSKRHYKDAFSHENSVNILMRGDDRILPAHFDPDLLDCLHDSGQEFADLFDAVGDEDAAIMNAEDAIG